MKLTVIVAAVLGVILVAQTEAVQLTVSEKCNPPSNKIKAVRGAQDNMIEFWDSSATGRVRLNPGHTPAVFIEEDLQCSVSCISPDVCRNFKFPAVTGQPDMDLCLKG